MPLVFYFVTSPWFVKITNENEFNLTQITTLERFQFTKKKKRKKRFFQDSFSVNQSEYRILFFPPSAHVRLWSQVRPCLVLIKLSWSLSIKFTSELKPDICPRIPIGKYMSLKRLKFRLLKSHDTIKNQFLSICSNWKLFLRLLRS